MLFRARDTMWQAGERSMFGFLQVVQGIVLITVVSGVVALYRSMKASRTPPPRSE
jgi:hypothetical protein